MSGTVRNWSNESVKRMAGGHDPGEAIVQAAREVVLVAIDVGWPGPPYDPFKLAEISCCG